ncbi:COG1470 family protein [Streptomyces sp. YIM S03343]
MPSADRAPRALRTALAVPFAALLALLATASATAPAASAEKSGQSGQSWHSGQSGQSAGWSAAPSGGARPSFYAEGAPGTVLRDTVSVTNRGTRPVTVRLGGRGLRLVFAGTRVTVPARTRADVPFALTVPADAAPGDRAGAVLVRDGGGRTATVRVRLRIGGPALSALTVEHVAVRGDRITYELVNRGTTVLVPTLAVHADGVLGTVLDRAPRTLPVRLPPGSRTRLGEPWPHRPALDAVGVRLTVTAAGGAHDTAGMSVRFVPAASWSGAAAVAGAGVAVTLAAGAVVAVVAVVRRLRRRTPEDGELPPPPAEHLCPEGELTTGAVA